METADVVLKYYDTKYGGSCEGFGRSRECRVGHTGHNIIDRALLYLNWSQTVDNHYNQYRISPKQISIQINTKATKNKTLMYNISAIESIVRDFFCFVVLYCFYLMFYVLEIH